MDIFEHGWVWFLEGRNLRIDDAVAWLDILESAVLVKELDLKVFWDCEFVDVAEDVELQSSCFVHLVKNVKE